MSARSSRQVQSGTPVREVLRQNPHLVQIKSQQERLDMCLGWASKFSSSPSLLMGLKVLILVGKKKNHPWQPQSCGEDTGATQDPCIREKSKEATTQFSCDTPHEQSATGPNNPATGTMSWIPSVCTKFCINILPVLSSSKFLSHREFSQQAYF